MPSTTMRAHNMAQGAAKTCREALCRRPLDGAGLVRRLNIRLETSKHGLRRQLLDERPARLQR